MVDSTPVPTQDIHELLRLLAEKGGSDMFLSTGALPHAKIDGLTQPISAQRLAPGDIRRMACQLMNAEQLAEFERELELNMAVGISQVGRFRLNLFMQRGEVGMVVRYVRNEIPPLSSLNLPAAMEKLALLDRGLILVVGSAGSGKSTTLASLLDHRNSRISGHIVCVEDPIEFVHHHKRSVVDQREVGLDTHSYAAALRNVLREAPDVIMLGEIRDQETMQHALHYSETGHLCVATLHATSAIQAIERIVHFFPETARKQVLNDLALNLVAIVAQRLVPGLQQSRVLAAELMLNTPHLRDLIKRDELHELKDAMARAIEQGVQTFDEHLYEHFCAGRINLEQALKHADSRTDLSLKIKLERGFSDELSSPSLLE